ncbi:MAG: sulfatase-like hydrolase/transferase [Pirellulaceae bacterium]|nr:sulfatase-like hydrolase/transferase [Pirellulaceae bacterium]
MNCHRRICKAIVLTLFVVTSFGAAKCRVSAADDRPNVLFIFADDQCFETVSALGHTDIETPNLDRLVRQGTTFTHAYNMGAWGGAVCVASRAMLNTGRYLWHAHDVYKTAEQERQAGRFWSEYLRKAGYDTYFSGKWHVRANAEKAFDFVNHVRPGMPNQTAQGYNRPIEGQPDEWSPFDRKFDGFWKDGKHWSEVLGDDAIGYLAQAAKRDKPFFMYLAFNAPHDPRQSPKAYVDKYPLDRIKVPENYLSEYPYKEEMGAGKSLRDEKLAPFPRTKYAVKVNRQEYYAIITHMDAQIGRILEALEKSGKRDNTWIFFTADHGLAVGHHGLLGKQNLYDHSVRVPFMVVGPGVAANAKNNTPIYLQDVMPTSLELAKVEKPDHVEFKSLLPVLSGTKTEHYDAIYGGYTDRQRMVTQDGYKLILYPDAKKLRLYHIDKDPLEMDDLAGEAKSQPVIKKLYEKFQELQRANGDKLDLALVFPQL